MAKVILVDNLNRETIADVLLEDDLTDKLAKEKADTYNKEHPHADWCAKAVQDSYKLWRGMEELV